LGDKLYEEGSALWMGDETERAGIEKEDLAHR
jgi:hypothetical protein